ncbi:MAG: hypothetical protein ACTHJR_03215 [Sphingomonas sp.]|uniref:hypothetical protein n=1 Tax=Sphingomonas sp. TaxID=28214 RepID=UPI003F81BFE5
MKRLALTLLATVALPGIAHAQSATDTATGDVGVSGTVARLCMLGTPTPAPVDLGQMANTSGTRVGKIATITPRTVTLAGSFCNFAGSAITVTATALVSDDASPAEPGFAKAVNYTAEVTNWAPGSAAVTTNATAGGASPTNSATGPTQPAPKVADLNVTLSNFTAPSDNLLTAGTYSGLVVVKLGPVATGGD